MAIARLARLGRQAKRPSGLWVKMAAVTILGLCFIFVWSMFSSSANSVVSQRGSFDDIAEPISNDAKVSSSETPSKQNSSQTHGLGEEDDKKVKVGSDLKKKHEKTANVSDATSTRIDESRKRKEKEVTKARKARKEKTEVKGSDNSDTEKEKEEQQGEEEAKDGKEEEEEEDRKEEVDGEEGEVNGETDVDSDLIETVDEETGEKADEESGGRYRSKGKKVKVKGPLFDPKAHYSWKLCSTRSKHNYIPCIDIETGSSKLQSYRHTERSCPRNPTMCLVPLPHSGYGPPIAWPESKSKILFKNVAHPKLSTYVKKRNWLVESGEYLTFPQNQSEFKGGVLHYLESVEEMVPDIEWGKNIRLVLDIGCSDASFVASLLDKDVQTLSLGLKDDLVDLAQVALERGFPAIVSPFSSRRLPFPSAVFDTIHCGGCNIPWHAKGGKLLLEMNRILRPGGYFILSTKHDSIEEDEAMSTLIASICWNILAHKADEASEMGVKIYQKPESNDIYELRRKKHPPLCKENENPDAAWYVSIKTCLHTVPLSIEQHGSEWPEEWPKRLHTYPDWINNKDKLIADTNHWKAIVDKSYLTGMGIDWSKIRNVIDMKAIYGGFAAALAERKVWVMNVVPAHSPDTLPVIYDRGLVGIYHDWCESLGTYPRSYDLLHADHLFSRLKNRCKQPISIVVEMDRVLRPGGWAIIRDKLETLDPLEGILRSLHWEIRMTYAQNKEGILCAKKTMWRP